MSYELPEEFFISKPYPALLAELLSKASSLKIQIPETTLDLQKVKIIAFTLNDLLICGVDGGSYGKGCEGEFIGIAAALSYTSGLKKITDLSPLFFADIYRINTSEGNLWLSLIERELTFRIALETILKKRLSWIFIHGGLLLWPRYFQKVEGQEVETGLDYEKRMWACIKIILNLLNACVKKGIGIVGVVENSEASLIKKGQRDIAILNPFLRQGEALLPLNPGKHPSLDHYEYCRKKEQIQLPTIDTHFFSVIYLRTTELKGAIRLEIPYWMDWEEAVSICISDIDPIYGLPLHISKANSLVKMSEDTFRCFYSRLLLNNPQALEYLRPLRGEEFKMKEVEDAGKSQRG